MGKPDERQPVMPEDRRLEPRSGDSKFHDEVLSPLRGSVFSINFPSAG
jgi:hypothetical protein